MFPQRPTAAAANRTGGSSDCIDTLSRGDVALSVEITFRYLPGEYLRALRAYQFRRARLIPDLTVSTLLVAIGVCALIWTGAFWPGLICVALALCLPVLYALALIMSARAAATNPKLKHEYRLAFSDQGISFSTEGIQSCIAWNFYRCAVRASGFYFLCYGRNQLTIIPERVFPDATRKMAFEALLRKSLSVEFP